MSDAAFDVFAEAFEEDPRAATIAAIRSAAEAAIREAVRAAMAKLVGEVRGLKRSPLPGWLTAQAEILALIEKATP